MDHSPPGSSVLGTPPARILEWVAISSSKGPSLHLGPTLLVGRLAEWEGSWLCVEGGAVVIIMKCTDAARVTFKLL